MPHVLSFNARRAVHRAAGPSLSRLSGDRRSAPYLAVRMISGRSPVDELPGPARLPARDHRGRRRERRASWKRDVTCTDRSETSKTSEASYYKPRGALPHETASVVFACALTSERGRDKITAPLLDTHTHTLTYIQDRLIFSKFTHLTQREAHSCAYADLQIIILVSDDIYFHRLRIPSSKRPRLRPDHRLLAARAPAGGLCPRSRIVFLCTGSQAASIIRSDAVI
ncbi:hypothetical protein EVAR_32666_1 [Eumeta japonica]|uniref:Uncharacterized protein n=1 Tax=Eumeta variegata TaxID=151549 RepID=A0A4C1WVQ9_EUMVA|nr:hypothetical protein EVAR_32666_1 [Eumeta japonica]